MTQSTTPFVCKVGITDSSSPLNLQVLLDNVEVYNSQIVQPTEIKFDINDEDGEHELQFVMSGKTHEHTKIDEQGNIIKDVLLEIKDIMIDDIDVTTLFYKLSQYTHDFNGTQARTTTEMHGSLGCNGVVSLRFTTPFYLYLLENM